MKLKFLAVLSGGLIVVGVNEVVIHKNYPAAALLWIFSFILFMISAFSDVFTFELKLK